MHMNLENQSITRLFFCDDSLLVAEIIKDYTQSALPKERAFDLRVFDDPKKLLEEWDTAFADAVMLDINMPQIDGFSLAERLEQDKPDVMIVFVSGYEDRVFQSYAYHPFWFIRKENLGQIEIVVPKLVEAIDAKRKSERPPFLLKAENRNIELNIDTLTYIESYKNDIILHDRVRGESRVRCKLSDAEAQLLPVHILRIQKGLLVNCRYIAKVTSRAIFLADGSSFNVGRDRIDFVRRAYRDYLDNPA